MVVLPSISTSHEFLIPSTVDDIEKYKLSAKDKSNSNKIRIYELVRYSAAHNFAYLSRIPITMKGILLMYIISVANVTFPCSSNMPSGRLYRAFIITFDGVLQVVLPFSDPMCGPNMSSALSMSLFLMGQLFMSPFSMY